jgi:NAD(P)-dependent dehydrogenase (short-subunit alcohol dehydrogenase family)
MSLASISLSGKVALVTGGAKRLGRACALALAREGVGVVVHYRSSKEEADVTAAAIRALGVSAWIVQGDQGDPDGAAGVFRDTVDQAGPIDFLVNNASIFPESRLGDFTLDDLMDNVRVNAFGPLVLARAFAAQQRPGAIVNFLDSRIADYDKIHAAYQLSKRMFFTMTRMMALEFAPRVRVNAVAPGLVLPPEGRDESYLRDLAHTNPLNAHGDENDVADAVMYLLRAKFVTGQILYVDGGRHMRGNVYGM